MTDILRATESQKAIFDEAFTSLATLDKLYRDDSDAAVAQRQIHEERIAESQAALERINESAGKREKELFQRRRQLGGAALNLYANYPEITDDRERAFSLAMQLDSGFAMEERDIQNAVKGLIALDNAIRDDRPILRCENGQFQHLVLPQPEAAGLSLVVGEGRSTSSDMVIRFSIPAAAEVDYPSTSKLFPDLETNTDTSVWIHSTAEFPRTGRIHRNTVSAKIASDYDVSTGIRVPRKAETGSGNNQVMYIIGHDLIQKSITTSAVGSNSLSPENTDFSYKTWLAGKLIGLDFTCDLQAIRVQIIASASEIIENTAKRYDRSTNPALGSDAANILIGAVRELGAEDELFETFASQLAKMGHRKDSVYRDPVVARILFDRVMSGANQSQ